MCGIAGVFHFDSTSASRERLQNMLTKIQRRGPDTQGIWAENHMGLAHARLSVIDLSPCANQPMVDDALGLVLVFNGAIYNYQKLRQRMIHMGYRFFSSGDSEIIIKAYHLWGKQCVEHLDGIFAFAIFDRNRQELFLARDRLGIKPLYYTRLSNFLLFASNPQALLTNREVPRQLDAVSIYHHMSLHAVVPAPRTVFQKIRKLGPGYTMQIRANGTQTRHRYWQLSNSSHLQPPKLDKQQWRELIFEKLQQAVVKRYQVSDIPVGVLLSGGLDSSLLVSILAHTGVKNISTYTIGFQNHGPEDGNEFCYSDQVADRYSTNHHRFQADDKTIFDHLPDAIGQMSEPMLGQDCIAFYLLAQKVSMDVRVVQSGQGADEVFGGYFWYQKMDAAKKNPENWGKCFADHYFDRDDEEYRAAVCENLHTPPLSPIMVNHRLRSSKCSKFIDAVWNFDITTLLVDDPVKRVDNMMMASGVEARVPFLDVELVETATAMPKTYKLQQQGKGILKDIARGLLPPEVIERKKGYFPVPALKFVEGKSRSLMGDILRSRACRERGLFRQDYLNHLLDDSSEPNLTRIEGNKLWHCALMEMWLQTHMDKP